MINNDTSWAPFKQQIKLNLHKVVQNPTLSDVHTCRLKSQVNDERCAEQKWQCAGVSEWLDPGLIFIYRLMEVKLLGVWELMGIV